MHWMALVLLPLAAPAPLCERPAPPPVSYHSRGFQYVAEIFPARSRQNRGSRPRAYVYQLEPPGLDWQVKARRIWSGELANQHFPLAALVSLKGDVVTLNDHGNGPDHALVIYDRLGKLVRSYRWNDFLTPAQIAAAPRSDCGLHWTNGASFYFTDTPERRLHVILHDRSAIEFDLVTGAVRRNVRTRFAERTGLPPNEEAHVWETSLRFSSITDALQRL